MTPDDQRRRYIALIRKGVGVVEAARIANQERAAARAKAENKPAPPKPVREPKPAAAELPSEQEVSEMPWPQLVTLAERCAGKRIKSRFEAYEAIKQARGSQP